MVSPRPSSTENSRQGGSVIQYLSYLFRVPKLSLRTQEHLWSNRNLPPRGVTLPRCRTRDLTPWIQARVGRRAASSNSLRPHRGSSAELVVSQRAGPFGRLPVAVRSLTDLRTVVPFGVYSPRSCSSKSFATARCTEVWFMCRIIGPVSPSTAPPRSRPDKEASDVPSPPAVPATPW